MIQRTFDEATGTIRVSSSGFWSAEDVAEHFAKMRTMIAALRDQGRPIRVLSDVTKAPRQRPSIEKLILAEIEQTFRTGDRIAILAANMGDKTHAQALLGKTEIAIFASRANAETWLLFQSDRPAVA